MSGHRVQFADLPPTEHKGSPKFHSKRSFLWLLNLVQMMNSTRMNKGKFSLLREGKLLRALFRLQVIFKLYFSLNLKKTQLMRNFKTRVEFLSYFLSKMLEIIQNIFPHYMAPLSRVFFFLCVTVLSLTSDLLHLEISAVMPFAPLLLSEVAVALFTLLLTFFSFGSLSERSSFL